MRRILVLTAHPIPSQSHINKRLTAMAGKLADVTVIDLYALYPRFKIDVGAEQERLKAHDVIVFQFPIYWYSTPALLKEWQDLVLEHGFAYGRNGTQLAGKLCLLAVTAGGAEQAYSRDGANQFPIRTLLSPLEQTANLCQMRFLPPLVLFSSLVASRDERAARHVAKYQHVLEALRDEQLDLAQVFQQEILGVPVVPLLSDKKNIGATRMDSVLLQAFIYLMAAVVAVPVAKRLGLGSVLGYLIAGVIIGPVVGLVGSETNDLQHFAEFGVVMMLFIVGLELEPKSLWEMRHKLLGLGGLQVLLSVLCIGGAAYLLGLAWQVSLAVGMVFSLSSTAIVLQTLNERNLMKTEGGESSFSVLLFQDIAVIPMLAIIPLLGMAELAGEGGEHAAGGEAESSINMLTGLAGWQQTLLTVAAVAFVIVVGHFLSRPIFRYISLSKLREMFTAAALLLVIGIALLMNMVGLSPALGTFLAGVVLATSEYRHELESDIEPFKGLLLGLFFITVGAGVDFGVLVNNIGVVLAITIGVMAIKAFVLYLLALVFGIRGSDRWLLFLGLAQAGEFGFVLISFCLQSAAIPVELSKILLLVVALSMLLTPALFIFFEKVVQPRMIRKQSRDSDEITEQGTVVIAGHGRFGQVINRLLLSNGYKTVVLDLHADLVETMRIFEVKSFYGDASRPDLLHAAGLQDAGLLVVAIDDQEAALRLIAHARRERPDLHIIARAYDRRNVYQLYQSGTDDIVRETADSALRAGRYALEALGMHPAEAERAATLYVDEELKGIRLLAQVYDPDIPVSQNPGYVKLSLEIKARMDAAMLGKSHDMHDHSEGGWRPPGNSVLKE